MSKAVVKMLKKVVELSNSNLVKNADGLFAKISVDNDIECVGKEKIDYRATVIKCRINCFSVFAVFIKYGPSN